MKKSYFLLGVVILILISALILRLTSSEDDWICQDGAWIQHGHPRAAMPSTTCPGAKIERTMVGNDRDEHGCIGSAGYLWCEAKQKCLRIWEEPCSASQGTTTPINGNIDASSSIFLVESPKQNELVSSPLKVNGNMAGSWFFEGSLPIKIVDENENVIASDHATAIGDWMTDKPVPYTANIVFTTKATSGYLILSKDNPSGLPQNDQIGVRVPIRFK
jgi:hypothetical protein